MKRKVKRKAKQRTKKPSFSMKLLRAEKQIKDLIQEGNDLREELREADGLARIQSAMIRELKLRLIEPSIPSRITRTREASHWATEKP